jgi:acylphosphatase
MKVAKHLKIQGLVQGVFFRESFKSQAMDLSLTGWIRNRKDGTVEAFVQGESEAIAKIEIWARSGPPKAKVEKVEVSDSLWDSNCTEFSRLPTE